MSSIIFSERTMKNLILLSLLLVAALTSRASHLMGGEITARQISPLTYEVTLTNYVDTLGIPAYPSVTFDLMDGATGITLSTSNAPFDTALSGILLPGYPYGVRVYVYRDTLTLPNAGTFRIGVSDCCRNATIQNMANPSSESLYLETTITAFAGANNSSPVFLAMPVVYLPAYMLWQYNPLPFDADGDSLVWSVDVPMTAIGQAVAGYTLPLTMTGGTAYNIDPATGTVSWTPGSMGNFVSSIKVEEYRNGVKIGEIRRDMQMIIVMPANKPPHFTNFNTIAPPNGSGQHILTIGANMPIQFSILVEDEDVADAVRIDAIGEPFSGADAATFITQPTGNGNEISGTFMWTPSASRARDLPYITVFRAKDQQFSFDETILFFVTSSISIDNAAALSQAVVYPNPASDVLTVSFQLQQTEVLSLNLYDMVGRRITNNTVHAYNAGNQVVKMPIDVQSGIYFLAIEGKDGVLTTQRVVVSK